jgi:hypothetical protein
MEPSCDAAAAPSTSTMNSRRFIRSSRPREHRCRDGQRMGAAASAQLRDRSRPWKHSTPADGVPKGDHLLDEGIAVSMAGQDDRLRRSSRTHRWVASIPPWPCTTRAERSNAGPSFRSAFENRASANRNHGSRRIRATTTVIKCTFTVIQDYLIQCSNRCPPRLRMLYSGFSHERQEDIGPFG